MVGKTGRRAIDVAGIEIFVELPGVFYPGTCQHNTVHPVVCVVKYIVVRARLWNVESRNILAEGYFFLYTVYIANCKVTL